MPGFETFAFKRENEDLLYEEREQFIKDNYPENKSHYEMEKLLNSGLDGMDVLEYRDKKGEIEGILSYAINQDHEEIFYCSIGIILTREESQGEGVMKALLTKIKKISQDNDCEYITAIADTEEGEEFLLENGFYEEEDEVNGREYLKYDL